MIWSDVTIWSDITWYDIIMWHQLLLQQKIKVPSRVDQGTASGINAMEVKLKPHLQLLQTRNRVNQDQQQEETNLQCFELRFETCWTKNS